MFWQRSLFFWGFIAAAFAAYGVLVKEPDKDLALVVSCFGFACSIAWTPANRGSKYWQVAWEQKLKSIETAALGGDFYSREEKNTDKTWWGAARYSVTLLTIALSDFAVLTWFVLALKASPIGLGIGWTCVQIIVVTATVAYIAAMLIWGRSRTPQAEKRP